MDMLQDTLDERAVTVPWVMHVKASLLHRIRQIRTRHCEILQAPGKAATL